MAFTIVQLFFILIVKLVFLPLQQCAEPAEHKYEIKQFEVPVDHFNYVNNKSFKMRYLFNDRFVDKNNDRSPLFFYAGNEGDIEVFANNTGFMWELAEKMKAYVVFAEHRYYGKSLPFEDFLNNTDHIIYLTVEQALEDYVQLISFLRGEKAMPVIAFGGSYGGMLAAWMRLKYPHIVLGALASSAPIWQFNGLTPCDIYNKIVASVFTTSYSPNCSANIKNSWDTLKNFSLTEEGRKEINSVFKLCDPMKQPKDIDQFLDYLTEVYGILAMVNYPYANNFLVPLPAYPVRQFCLYLKESHKGADLLKNLQAALSVYSNYTGTKQCIDFKSKYGQISDDVWNVQACSEIVMPMCSDDTMFRKAEWNYKTFSDDCFSKYKLRPRLNDMVLRFGDKNLQFASNIIFSNGLLDPWSGGGVLQTSNSKITVIIIPEGAHHLDLRSSQSEDPQSVQEARKQETKIIAKWIAEYLENAH